LDAPGHGRDGVGDAVDDGARVRVLVVRVGAMGDVVHGLAAVSALRRARPGWVINWVVDERWAELLGAPLVDEVIAVRTRDWNRRPFSWATLRDVLGLRRRLRGGGYDLCIDLQGTMRSAVIGWMAGARRYLGPAAPREGLALGLYGTKVTTAAAHVVAQGCELVSAGLGERVAAGDCLLPVDAGMEMWAEGVLDGLFGGRWRGRLVVIAASAGWRSKEWGFAKFGELAGRLEEAGYCVVVNADLGGGLGSEEVVRASGGRARALGCSIGQLTSLLRRSSLVVGGDTGPLHLADALGIAVVGLFGPTDPGRNGPYFGMRRGVGRVLRHVSSVTDHGRSKGTEAGLGRIGVDEVFGSCLEVLGDGGSG
jgi:heptosyltransferase-1